MGNNSPSNWNDYGPTQPEGTGDLAPIGNRIRVGLEVIGALAVLSLILCSSLFLFITYRIIDGRLRDKRLTRHRSFHEPLRANDALAMEADAATVTLTPPAGGGTSTINSHSVPTSPMAPSPNVLRPLKLEGPTLAPIADHSSHSMTGDDLGPGGRTAVPNIRRRYTGYHPLLVLIYMLLIADIIQSASFIPNLVWVRHDAIRVRTGTCWAQGWLRSQGDMASSLFAAAVSINTYLMVVRRYTIPSKALWSIVGTIWSFSFLIVAAGVWSAQNGKGNGGYFVRVDTWCWISSEYASTRLWTHFGWVLSCFGVIIFSHLATAVTFYKRPESRGVFRIGVRNPSTSGHHPAFLIYPLVYFICCAPMALGPMILLAGVTVKAEYFLWAGAMIASNGWLDVILWSCTMIFLAPRDIRNAGLQDFRFLRTSSVKYGNIVWVEGGHGREPGEGRNLFRPPWRLGRPLMRTSKSDDRPARRGFNWGFELDSTESRDARTAIQIERSTTVVVEDCGESKRNSVGVATTSRRVSDIVSVPKRVAHLF